MRRIGLFGGTFDPIHNAHIEMARAAIEQQALDELLLIPAKHPPHREAVASYLDRFRMVEIACRDHPAMHASALEDVPGPSYTIDTVERFRRDGHHDAALFFIIGADAFREIPTWRRWRELADQVTFIVVDRPGTAYDTPPGLRVCRLDALDLPVSASAIRRKLARGERLSDLPPAVLDYIRARGLYGIQEAPASTQ